MSRPPFNTDSVDNIALAFHVATGLPRDDERVRQAARRVLDCFHHEIIALKVAVLKETT